LRERLAQAARVGKSREEPLIYGPKMLALNDQR
jgi:hypothetical protein